MLIQSGTLIDLEKSLAAEFESIFAGQTFTNSAGHRVKLKSFIHSLPVKQGYDEEPSDEDLPEPYIVAEATGGKQASPDDPHVVSAAAVICVCDDSTARQGHQDILMMIHRIMERFNKNPILDRKFVLQHPIEWSLSDEDTYPYYYGGLMLNFEVPAIHREDSFS